MGSVEQILPTERRRRRDAVDFVDDLIDFSAGSGTGGGIIAAGVRSLNGEVTGTLQERVDLGQGTFCRLHDGDAILGVANGDLEATDLRTHALADAEASGVVSSAVDAESARQLLQALRHLSVRDVQVAVGVGCCGVLIDTKTHGNPP